MLCVLNDIPSEVYEAYLGQTDQLPKETVNNGICSENPFWEKSRVPRLSTICIKSLGRFFIRYPRVGLSLKGADRALLMENLSTRLPLALSAEFISDESYWLRCCKEELPRTCDVRNHGGSYKRMFMEKHVQRLLEEFRPLEMDLFDIKDLLSNMEPFIKRLEVDSMLPSIVYTTPGQAGDFEDDDLSGLGGEEDEDETNDESRADGGKSPDGSLKSSKSSISEIDLQAETFKVPEINMKVPGNHLDFGTILPSLKELQEIKLCFQVHNCGMNFRWNLLGMTIKDAEMLGMGLKTCKRLRQLSIVNSHMDDEKFYAIFDGLKNINRIEELNVPNNLLSDDSMTCIVKLLTIHPVHKLDMASNEISCEGVGTLAKNLNKSRLRKIVLALNKVGDNGCAALCQALESNRSVTHLDLSSNRLTSSSGQALGNVLRSSRTLQSLNISGNDLKEEGGRSVLEGARANDTILRLDVRLTGCGKSVDVSLQEKIRDNKSKKLPPVGQSRTGESTPDSTPSVSIA